MQKDVTPQMKVALAYVDMFNTGDLDIFAPLLSEDVRHRTHPLSLGRPFRTKEEYLTLLRGYSNWLQVREMLFDIWGCNGLLSMLGQVEVNEVNESPGKVWIHVRSFKPLIQCAAC